MTVDGLHHLVPRVPDLTAAESFYRDLFELDVPFREGVNDEEVGKVPNDLDWAGAVERGAEPTTSFLGRDAFALALTEETGDANAGRLDHVALSLDASDRDAIRDRAADLDCEYGERDDAVFVTDRSGVEWGLNASSPPLETPFDPLDA